MLQKTDRSAARASRPTQDEIGCTPREVAPVRCKSRMIRFQDDARRPFFQKDFIRKADGLHDHLHFMVAVGTLAQDIQCQIDLRPRQKLQQVKYTVLSHFQRKQFRIHAAAKQHSYTKFYQFLHLTASLLQNLVGINHIRGESKE